MKAGSKYYSILEHLRSIQAEEFTLSFAQIEAILGHPLPASARTQRSWWSNRKGATQAEAWMEAGYQAHAVNLVEQHVTFRKPMRRYEVRREGDRVLWNGDMVKALRLHMGLNQTQFADELGVRQQTISEWENGIYTPSRATCKYLSMVAEQAQFPYESNRSSAI